MASQFIDFDILRHERLVLEDQILTPLQVVKASVSERLTSIEVSQMLPFLQQDVKQETLNQIRDGQTLIAVLDLYYGRDNLKVLERLLRKINRVGLLRILQEWRIKNGPVEEAKLAECGYFPLWLKMRTTFSQFYKSRVRLFNILKILFDVPELDTQDPYEELLVYMAVSLGKKDILITVLFPLTLKPRMKALLGERKVCGALEHLGIIGVYFSRKKSHKLLIPPLSHNGYLSESTESLSSTITSDSTFEKSNASYLAQTRQTVKDDIAVDGFSKISGDSHYCKSELLPTSEKLDYGVKPMQDVQDQNLNNFFHSQGNGTNTNGSCLIDGNVAVVAEHDPQCHSWQKLPDSQYGFVARYHQTQNISTLHEYKNCYSEAEVAQAKSKHALSCEDLTRTTCQLKKMNSEDGPIAYDNERHNGRDINISQHDQGQTLVIQAEIPDKEPSKKSFNSPKMARVNGIVARSNQATGGYNAVEENISRTELIRQQKLPASFEEISLRNVNSRAVVEQKCAGKLEEMSAEREFASKPVETQNFVEMDIEVRNADVVKTAEYPAQKPEPETPHYVEKEKTSGTEHNTSHHHLFRPVHPDFSTDQERTGDSNDKLSTKANVYNSQIPSHKSKTNGEISSPKTELTSCSSDKMIVKEPFEENRLEVMDQSSLNHVPNYEQRNDMHTPTFYTQYKDERIEYLEGHPRHSVIFMKADSDVASESHMEYEDSVFTDETGRQETAPPPYHSPPDYKKAKESLKRKSHKSFDDLSSCFDLDHRPIVRKQLLSAASISTLYREKRGILDEKELEKSVQSANEKEYEKQMNLCKDLLSVAKSGDDLEAQRLIEEGADVNFRNEFGQTAAIIASREGNLGVIEALLAAGADLNHREGFGKSALHEAAWKGEHQVAHSLISGGADINIIDEEGRTPLHYASMRGRRRIVELLLLFGADATLLNKNGESAAENAYCYKHNDIMDLLLSSRDKKTRKTMEQQIRKKKLQDLATSLPNLSKSSSLKDVSRSKSRPDLRKRKQPCVIQ